MELTPPEKYTLETYNRSATQWSSEHSSRNFWREEMRLFQTLLPHGKILELGSGWGRDAKELIDLGYSYVGTDISINLLEMARKENPGSQFLNQSVYDLNFPPTTLFDGFWASAVLLHIPKNRINEALKNIHRFVKEGGIGFISLKQGEGEVLVNQQKNGWLDRRFFANYTIEEFEQILQKNNFETMKTTTHPMGERVWLCFFVRVKKQT